MKPTLDNGADMTNATQQTSSYLVVDYARGDVLEGTPTAALVTASLEEHSGSGAVCAIRRNGVWAPTTEGMLQGDPDSGPMTVYVVAR